VSTRHSGFNAKAALQNAFVFWGAMGAAGTQLLSGWTVWFVLISSVIGFLIMATGRPLVLLDWLRPREDVIEREVELRVRRRLNAHQRPDQAQLTANYDRLAETYDALNEPGMAQDFREYAELTRIIHYVDTGEGLPEQAARPSGFVAVCSECHNEVTGDACPECDERPKRERRDRPNVTRGLGHQSDLTKGVAKLHAIERAHPLREKYTAPDWDAEVERYERSAPRKHTVDSRREDCPSCAGTGRVFRSVGSGKREAVCVVCDSNGHYYVLSSRTEL
jgi:hypothetical protein